MHRYRHRFAGGIVATFVLSAVIVVLLIAGFRSGVISFGVAADHGELLPPQSFASDGLHDTRTNRRPADRVPLAVVPGARTQRPTTLSAANRLSILKRSNPALSPLAVVPVAPRGSGAFEAGLHPSLKYRRNMAGSVNDKGISEAASRLPTVSLGGSESPTTQPSKIQAAARMSAQPVNRTVAWQAVVDANLALEDGRKFVTCICLDHRGCLWVGTEGGGVQRFDPAAPELHQWRQYTTKDGLGDNYAYALTCDHQGRVWVGHLNHGVSVFDGSNERWQCYEVLSGLSRPDTLAGPLGERTFAIEVSPVDGDVWIATNCGLTRYREVADEWSYDTQVPGGSTIPVESIAFDTDGNIYCGTECDGVAIADASTGYMKWRWCQGPRELPPTSEGEGLPSNLINKVVMTASGRLYAATDAGLSWSDDRGVKWKYIRGADWIAKVKGRYGGPPQGWEESSQARGVLAEDYCTTVAASVSSSFVYVGHRERDVELVNVDSRVSSAHQAASTFSTALLSDEHKCICGTYGLGIQSIMLESLAEARTAAAPTAPPSLPHGAAPMTLEEIKTYARHTGTSSTLSEGEASDFVGILEDDWLTQGAWLGRYGRYFAVLPAMQAPLNLVWGEGQTAVSYHACIEPQDIPKDTLRYWVNRLYTKDNRSLEMPSIYLHSRVLSGATSWDRDRRQAEWDDHGEVYARTRAGPNIYCTVEIPSGGFDLSLYDYNRESHRPLECLRDYYVSVRIHRPDRDLGDVTAFNESLEIAHYRITHFEGGVFKRVRVHGPTTIDIKVDRNYSWNTMVCGVMLDPVDDFAPPLNEAADSTGDALYSIHSQFRAMNDAGRVLLRALNAEPLQSRRGARLLERLLSAHPATVVAPDYTASTIAPTVLFRAGLFDRWEQLLQKDGLPPLRQLEKELRWDGRTELKSGAGYDILAQALKLHFSTGGPQ